MHFERMPHPAPREQHGPQHASTPDRIPTTFNLFMNVDVQPTGAIAVLPPRSRAGERIVLRAEMDLIVGLTACSAEQSNNYAFKPIDYGIVR